MLMAMMELGYMWMIVHQRHMSVQMCVRFLGEPALMFMLVVATMLMPMVMCDFLMDVEVVMMFPKQEHDPIAITNEAHISLIPHRSPRMGIAAMAPTNGAAAKNPASRAAPNRRRACMSSTRLTP